MRHAIDKLKIRVIFMAILVLGTTAACGMKSGTQSNETSGFYGSSEYQNEVRPLWETAKPGTNMWSVHAYNVIEHYGPALLDGAKDIASFCPSYTSLSRPEKISFWVYLVSAMVKYESQFNPVARVQEKTMGTDSVTGLPTWSEGLLQLSYQDGKSYSFCNEFDWTADQVRDGKDPQKTILSPYKNLTCGIRILNWQINRYDELGVTTGNYWSVLRTNGAYTKIPEIKALTTQIPFCK